MQLRKLRKEDQKSYQAFINSWREEKITPYSARLNAETYEEYLKQLNQEEQGTDEWVPAETYFLFLENGDIAGAINCRYGLNDFLKNIGGHIGYGVSPTYRGQGYAKWMLDQVLSVYSEKGFSKVLLTANDDNYGSVKSIQACGGVHASSGIKEDGSPFGRYWIQLEK